LIKATLFGAVATIVDIAPAAAVIFAPINIQPAAAAIIGALTNASQQFCVCQQFNRRARDVPKRAVKMNVFLRPCQLIIILKKGNSKKTVRQFQLAVKDV